MTTLLNSGTYGCIFHPSVNVCNGNLDQEIDSEHYITKIQRYEKDDDELAISREIQTIPHYEQYFAPIVKTCVVRGTNINYDLVRACKEMQNDFSEFNSTIKYSSSKVRYVGKYNISKYIKTVTDPLKKLKKIVNTHLHILDAVQYLISKKIVHFDLKSDNIMFDDIQSIPIIIDFGISKNLTPLRISVDESIDVTHKELLKQLFISDESYDFWCIDIFIICNIVYERNFYMTSVVTHQALESLLENFKTQTFTTLLTPAEIRLFEMNYKHYFSKYVLQKETWVTVLQDLLPYYPTWDNYAVAMSYLYMCKRNPGLQQEQTESYITMLKGILTAMPNKRMSPKDTQSKVRELFV
jgi:serine/threonine protein kinase